jgi:signal transduction histidine kinase
MATDDAGRTRLPSLVRRIALASAGAAALGGALAAIVGGVIAGGLVGAHEDGMVRVAAVELAEEVEEEIRGEGDDDDDDDDEPRTPAAALVHELEDVKLPGARARLVDRAGVAVGTIDLQPPAAGECAVGSLAGAPRRACSVATDKGVLTLEVSAAAARERNGLVAFAVLVGALAGAVVGGVLSSLVGRSVAAPLVDLRARVSSIRTSEPDPTALAGRSASLETEDLRLAIAELVGRLAEALSHAQAFASQAAHELRTPLSTIAAELELLAERSDRPDALERPRRHVLELVALVQRLLVLARPGEGELARDGTAVDLGDVVAAVSDGLTASDAARVHAVVDDDVLVRGDADLLRVLLSNAVDNALKFARGIVDVRVHSDRDDAVVDVIDDGPGIAPADRARVFTPFFRSAAARASGTSGHGIGLALVVHVARAHGGDVELVDVARGAHLRVRLPRWGV